MIRKATINDLEAVECLYEKMHDAKEAGLICTNWKRGIYPSRATALSALERQDLFVMEENGRIIGSGIINHVQLRIYAGASWKHNVPDNQVCVLHTMMISPAEFRKGHAGTFLAFYEHYALEHGCPELRVVLVYGCGVDHQIYAVLYVLGSLPIENTGPILFQSVGQLRVFHV